MRHIWIAAVLAILLVALGILTLDARGSRPVFNPGAISTMYDLTQISK